MHSQVPLRCVGEDPFELGAEAVVPSALRDKGAGGKEGKGGKGGKGDDGFSSSLSALAPTMPPVSITLWKSGAAGGGVKHVFFVQARADRDRETAARAACTRTCGRRIHGRRMGFAARARQHEFQSSPRDRPA